MEQTKGLEAGSLFKLCMVGLMSFMISMAVFSFIGGMLFDGEWTGPQGEQSYSHSVEVNGETISEESVEQTTSQSFGGLVAYLAMTPFIGALFAGLVWITVFMGQYLYTLRKTIQIKVTEKGICFISAFKVIFIGNFFCYLAWGLLISVVALIEPSADPMININDGESGPLMTFIISIILVPIISAIAGALIGLMVAIGNFAFTLIKPMKYVVIPTATSSESTSES